MKAISPVIATVIIIAVAISIAIAVAFWITGISTSFTRYEKLTIVTAYAIEGTNEWRITLHVSNTGSSDTTIDEIYINGKPYSVYSGISVYYKDGKQTVDENTDFSTWNTFSTNGISLNTGETVTIAITIPTTSSEFTHGSSTEIKIHTSSGGEYPKMVVLP